MTGSCSSSAGDGPQRLAHLLAQLEAQRRGLDRAAGFEGIGLWEMKLGDDDADVEALRESGLEATNCVPRTPPSKPLELTRKISRSESPKAVVTDRMAPRSSASKNMGTSCTGLPSTKA